ncbi:hypothetical protein AB6A40_002987 [Gnathostoma spinigerum]|uniref:EGF-like domain-containing protein n=1 Tax=Gnathostoma spinigerum TaxID=75299 RepID=A0ABD6E8B9_9BILA
MFPDIDECTASSHNCSIHAVCKNTPGSFVCDCQRPFQGDGFSCLPEDPCFTRFNRQCSANAICETVSKDKPECICHEGYHGDGLTCTPVSNTSDNPLALPDDNNLGESPDMIESRELAIPQGGETATTDDFDETPFIMNNWIAQQLEATSRSFMRQMTKNFTQTPPVGKDYDGIEDDVYVGGKVVDETDNATTLFLVVPIALCGVFLILIAVMLAVCCHRKRTLPYKSYDLQGMHWPPERNIHLPYANYGVQY